MLKSIKRALAGAPRDEHNVPAHERRQLHIAVAVLLHEARRADYVERAAETSAAEQALHALFGLDREECAALLEQGRDKAAQLTSFYAPVTIIKRDLALPERVRLVEQLWRVAFADGQLDAHEDQYVRKIAHLLYVPNTDSMLARNRARTP